MTWLDVNEWMRGMAKKPVLELRRGLIVVRLWRKRTKSGPRFTTTMVRLFRNGESWKESSRLGMNDLPVARLLLQEAFLWMCQTEAADCPLR